MIEIYKGECLATGQEVVGYAMIFYANSPLSKTIFCQKTGDAFRVKNFKDIKTGKSVLCPNMYKVVMPYGGIVGYVYMKKGLNITLVVVKNIAFKQSIGEYDISGKQIEVLKPIDINADSPILKKSKELAANPTIENIALYNKIAARYDFLELEPISLNPQIQLF